MAELDKTKPVPAPVLTEEQRGLAMKRFDVLRPHLEEHVSLAHAAQHAGVAVRTAERWLSPYRKKGFNGLARSVRSDANAHHLPPDVVAMVEGMG